MTRGPLFNRDDARNFFPNWESGFTPSQNAWQRYLELKSAKQSLKSIGFGFLGISLGGVLAFVAPGERVIAKALYVLIVCVVAVTWELRYFLNTRAARLALDEEY